MNQINKNKGKNMIKESIYSGTEEEFINVPLKVIEILWLIEILQEHILIEESCIYWGWGRNDLHRYIDLHERMGELGKLVDESCYDEALLRVRIEHFKSMDDKLLHDLKMTREDVAALEAELEGKMKVKS